MNTQQTMGLRALLIQIGIKHSSSDYTKSSCLRALLIQIGIKLKKSLVILLSSLRALLIQIGNDIIGYQFNV